jgi:hypothetical protein
LVDKLANEDDVDSIGGGTGAVAGAAGVEDSGIVDESDLAGSVKEIPLPEALATALLLPDVLLLVGMVIRLGAEIDEDGLSKADEGVDSLPVVITSTIKFGVDKVESAKGGATLRTISPSSP